MFKGNGAFGVWGLQSSFGDMMKLSWPSQEQFAFGAFCFSNKQGDWANREVMFYSFFSICFCIFSRRIIYVVLHVLYYASASMPQWLLSAPSTALEFVCVFKGFAWPKWFQHLQCCDVLSFFNTFTVMTHRHCISQMDTVSLCLDSADSTGQVHQRLTLFVASVRPDLMTPVKLFRSAMPPPHLECLKRCAHLS